MMEFLHMGGYAPYVWSAYGITLLVVALNIWSANRRRAETLERARRLADEELPRPRPTVRQVQ
jgi:heme exporter protein D